MSNRQIAEGLARAWAKTWSDAFIQAYEDGVDTTHADNDIYPGNDAIAYAIACANADTFAHALMFAGLNAERRLQFSRHLRSRRYKWETEAPSLESQETQPECGGDRGNTTALG